MLFLGGEFPQKLPSSTKVLRRKQLENEQSSSFSCNTFNRAMHSCECNETEDNGWQSLEGKAAFLKHVSGFASRKPA